MAIIRSQNIADVIGIFYEAAYDFDKWQAAVASLHHIWDGAILCVTFQNMKTNAGAAIHTEGVAESFYRSYFEEYAQHNLIESALVSAPVGTIFTDATPVPKDIWRASKFWNEWMAPQDLHFLLGGKVQLSGDVMGTLQIQRGRRQNEFGDNDILVLKQLLPHISRAASLGHRVGTLKLTAAAGSMALEALAISEIVVLADAHIVQMTDAAEALLSEPGARLLRRNNCIMADDAATTRHLHRLIVDACTVRSEVDRGRGGDLLIQSTRPGMESGALSVSVGPLTNSDRFGVSAQPCAVILIQNVATSVSADFENRIRSLFGLTPTEARLTSSLLSGRTLKDAAAEQQIRFGTARSYLEKIFHKTGTNQQSQLVALLKSMPPLIRR